MDAYLENNYLVGKVGEIARVPVAGFNLDGARRRRLRRSQKQARESGVTVSVVPAGQCESLLRELKGVSDGGRGRSHALGGRRSFTRFTGRFYDFEGLREFKQSFDPDWEPRYLASSPGIARSLVLAHLAALTSGGIAGMFRK